MKIEAHHRKVLLVAIISLLLIPLLANSASGVYSVSDSILTKDPLSTVQLGLSIAVSGDRMVVGAPFVDSAYVFTREGDTWDEGYRLDPPSGADSFGWDVGISGDRVIVGAFDFLNLKGSAHVYRYEGANWVHEAKLISGLGVGASVAIDGNTVVVGAIIQSSMTGSVYVFNYEDSIWVQEDEELTAADTSFPAFYGWDVAISGNTAVVGAPSFAYGPAGTAHVFKRDIAGGPWTEIDIPLTPETPMEGTYYGGSVAIDGNTVVVGAPSLLYPYMNSGDSLGSAHVFRLNPDNIWVEESLPIPAANDFGNSVDISGDTVVVGAPFWDDLSKGEEGIKAGATYVFSYVGGSWVELEKSPLLASDGGATDQFGWSVAIDGDTVAVGAPFWDDLDAPDSPDSGAAYAFVLPSPNQPPIAEAIADPETVKEGDLFTLNGSGSHDPDGDPLTYNWVQTGGPKVDLNLFLASNDPKTIDPAVRTFVAPELADGCDTLIFQLTVTEDFDGVPGLASDPVTVEISVVPNNKIYAKLGGKHRHWLYLHKYSFYGHENDQVTVKLEADPNGWNLGRRATLILKDKIRGVRLFKTNRGSLPNEISATLPADGKYTVYVLKHPWFWSWWRHKSFRGDYILTLEGTCGKLVKGFQCNKR